MDEPIFLIGFMGAGKTRFGKRLANKMNLRFIDSDQEIEAENKQTVAQLFDEIGEEGFRNLETKWLEDFSANHVIVALGGGTPCYNNNMELIKSKGKSIYLQLSAGTLTDRLQRSKDKRPLIEPFKDNREKLRNFIEQKLTERETDYKQAHLTFNGQNMTARRLSELITLLEEKQIK